MRKYLLSGLWLIFLTPLFVHAQTKGYHVVRVVGSVESASLKRALKTEDVIPEDDHLKFKTKQDYLVIFHPKTGRKRIQGVPDEQSRELNTLIQSFLKPDEKSTGTRGGNKQYVEALKASLQGKVLILGDGVIELDPAKLSLKAPASIKAEFKTKTKEKVTSVVSKGQSLHLDRKSLYGPNTDNAEILLLYFLIESSSAVDAEEYLGNFTPLYTDETTLLPEVKTIVESLKGSPAVEIEKQVSEYLRNEYARPQPQLLHKWLVSHHLLPDA